jgi:chemotaxis protein MotA
LWWVFFDKAEDPKQLVATLVGFALRARKNGIVSLDVELQAITDPFLKKALMLAVDGIEPEELRKMMELELDNQAEHSEKIAQVFESAGGFAPTIGIIGAVLGLIQVMQHLANIDEVGKRNCRRIRCHHLRRGIGQPSFSAFFRQTQNQGT